MKGKIVMGWWHAATTALSILIGLNSNLCVFEVFIVQRAIILLHREGNLYMIIIYAGGNN